MRFLPLTVATVAVVLAGCQQEPGVNMVDEANRLAKVIAAEQDHVSVPELSDWIIKDQRDYELVDIRGEGEFAEGHIENARNIPLAALLTDGTLASLPPERKVVVYSNGTAHAAQAALLLRLADREAYALLGGYNHWQAYLNDPESAGVAAMDPVRRAKYQAVACYFEGDYVADAGLAPRGGASHVHPDEGPAKAAAGQADPLGLGLGLGSEQVKEMDVGGEEQGAGAVDALGLGLGLGGEAAEAVRKEGAAGQTTTRKLLIKAEC